jgi:7-cyano-7-deazaguanine synthase in queuosine biosynthesis
MKLYDEQTDQTIDFFIPDQYKKIAINCSGGADSSILLYTTVKFLQEHNRLDTKIIVLTCANDFKGRWNAKNATSVINFIIEKTKTQAIDLHLIYYRDFQKTEYFHKIESELFSSNKIDLVVSGITANPLDNTVVLNINNELIDLKTDALVERNKTNRDAWYKNSYNTWYNPFVNVDKKAIAALYKHYNITDSLLPLTRSCESFADVTENFTKPCGTCWWCLERKWAFGEF